MSEVQGQGPSLDAPNPSTPRSSRQATKAELVHQRLILAYAPRQWHPHGPPLDQLIATILSQHTSDANSGRAFESLRRAFPSWEQVLAADEAAIADAIRVGGLAGIKAPRIKALLAGLAEQHGTLSLDFLAEMDAEDARAALMGIPGVGPKTAACVLLFSLGRPVIPVDTHVHRVSLRLGLAPLAATPEQVERALEAQLPPEASYSCHVSLVTHGRRVCRAQRPLCEACPLADLCDYFQASREGGQSPSHPSPRMGRRGANAEHLPGSRTEEVDP